MEADQPIGQHISPPKHAVRQAHLRRCGSLGTVRGHRLLVLLQHLCCTEAGITDVALVADAACEAGLILVSTSPYPHHVPIGIPTAPQLHLLIGLVGINYHHLFGIPDVPGQPKKLPGYFSAQLWGMLHL